MDAAPASAGTPVAQPVAPAERLFPLDALRGLALLGILLVNMAVFTSPMLFTLPGLRPDEHFTRADRVALGIVDGLASTKFYNLFAFLFGTGFAIQMIRAEQRGADVGRLFVRRFLALLGIGLVHAFLIWSGDVLVTYALTGFFLLLCRRCSLKVALIVAGILFGSTALLGLAGVGVMEMARLIPEGRAALDDLAKSNNPMMKMLGEGSYSAYGRGSFVDVLRHRAIESGIALFNVLGMGPLILATFLLGLQAGRYGLFQNVEHYRPLLRKMVLWGLVVGVPTNLFFAWAAQSLNPLSAVCAYVMVMGSGGPAFALVYAAGLTLLLQRAVWRRLFTPIAAAGRMALTNYLMQSLVCTTVSYGYGLGWYGKVSPSEGLLLALTLWGLQVPLSVLWLRAFLYGPMEWVWRWMTYGQKPPLLRRHAEEAVGEAA